MKWLQILLSANMSWDEFVSSVTETIGVAGTDKTDESGNRHVWRVLNVEITGYDEPGLEDDQGIDLSKFNFCLDQVHIFSIGDSLEEESKFGLALARFTVVRLRKKIVGNVELVDNLQKIIPIP